MDVLNRDRPFDVMDFLLSNKEDLSGEETFYEYGAKTSCILEEPEILLRFLNWYVSRLNPSESRLSRFISELDILKETSQCAGTQSRVIFDCHSEIDGIPFTGMKAGYWDITLGRDLFLPSFENGFIGVRKGEEKTFTFTFPKDHIPVKLRSETVEVWAKVYKVLNPVKVKSIEELKSLDIRNHYSFPDLDRLVEEDSALHYLASKDIPEQDLVKMPVHLLMQMNKYAKLHRIKDVERITGLLSGDKKALNAVGDMLYSAGRYLEAAHYYDKSNLNQSDVLIKKARSFFLGGHVKEALEIVESVHDNENLSFQELLLGCLKEVEPNSERILSLERHVLDLKVRTTLRDETEALQQHQIGCALEPIVHGVVGA